MNRNVVTPDDVAQGSGHEKFGDAPGGQLTEDDFWARLLKFIPVEMISAYLIVHGILLSAYEDGTQAQSWALGILLVLTAIATWFFAARVLNVVRKEQLAVTVVALIVWAFAMGGWFATTDWWMGWMGTVAVVAFGVLVQIVRLPALPVEPESQPQPKQPRQQ